LNKKYISLIKDTMVFSLGNIGSKVIIFFLVPLYTNILTTEEYGNADLVFTISQLMMPIISVAIYNAIIRFGLEKKDHSQDVLLCGIIVWFFGCFVSVLVSPLFTFYEPVNKWRWYLIIYTDANILLTITQNYLKVKGLNFRFSIISIIQTLFLASLNVFFLVIFKWGMTGYILSNALTSLLTVFLAIVMGNVINDIKSSCFDKELLKKMVIYSAPLILNNLAWWIIQSSDKVMIELFVGASALGLYTVATRIPSLVNVVVSIFMQAWGISSTIEMDSTNDNQFYENVFNAFIVITFGAGIFINLLIKPFMSIYVGSEFFEAWKLTPILVVSAAAFSAVAAFYGALYAALKKSVNNMISTFIAAIINIVMNLVFIYLLGTIGAVFGTMISYLVLAIIRMLDVNRMMKMRIDYRVYFLNCILVIIDSVFITFDYFITIVSIITIAVFIFINIKEIKKIYITTKRIISSRRKE